MTDPWLNQTPDWVERGLCRHYYYDAWYADTKHLVEYAKNICQSCPVRTECLEHALKTDERHGIWGGLSYLERRRYACATAHTG